MAEPVSLFSIAACLLTIILRTTDQTTVADLVGDARDSLGLLTRLRQSRNTPTPITQRIEQNLSRRTRELYTRCRDQGANTHSLSAVMTEVEILLKETAHNDSLLILAVRSEDAFREALRTQAAKHRAMVEQALEPYFDALIDAVTKEYHKLAPWSPQFQSTAFKYAFSQLETILSNTDQSVTLLNEAKSELADLKTGQSTLIQILTDRDTEAPLTPRIVTGNRPYVGARYVDRIEQDTLHQCILKEIQRRTVLIGMRGSGKSQLASSLARRCEAEGWKLVVWINASSFSSLQSGLTELALKLGVYADENTTQDQLIRRCLDQIQSSETADRLIILDNVENIDHLTNVIPEGDGLRVVVTTNSSCGWKHQSWKIIQIGMFTSQEALTFLLEATGSTDRETAAVICERLGNLPLALAQAAATACSEDWTLKQYLARLDAHKSGLVLRPAPGDSYREEVSTALQFAVKSALGNLHGQQLEIARKQLGILALLAATGIPTRWLDPLANDDADHLIFDATSENTHRAMNTLISASVVQQSDTKRITMLHRLQSQVIREHLADSDLLYTAQQHAAEFLAHVTLEELPSYNTSQQRQETRNLIEQLRAISMQSYSREIYKNEILHTCLESIFTHAEELGLPYDALTLEKSVQIVESTIGADNRLAMCLRGHLAGCHRSAGQLKYATELFEINLNKRRNALGKEDPDTLTAQNQLANAYREAGHLSEAIQLYQHTFNVRDRNLGAEHHQTQISRGNLAAAYKEIGRYFDSIQLASENLEIRRRLYGPEDRKTLFSQASLANSYTAAGHFDDAIRLHTLTFEARQRILGKTHLRTLRSQVALAKAHREQGNLKQAMPLFQEALLQRKRILGARHPATLVAQDELARTYLAMNVLDVALTLFEQVLLQRQDILGLDHPRTLKTQDGLARTYLAQGRHDEAITLHKQTVIQYLNILGTQHPETLTAQDGLARAYFEMGRHAIASEVHHNVFSQRRAILGTEHPYTIASYTEFKKAYHLTNATHG